MNRILSALNKMVAYVDAYKEKVDPVVAGLLAFTPILQHYRGPVFNAALTVIVLLVPYLLLRLIPKLQDFQLSSLNAVFVMCIYLIYRIVDHGTSITELGQSGVLFIYMIVLAQNCIDLKSFCRTAAVISLSASALLVLQYICFYLFRFHVQLVPTQLLIPSADQWILGAQTGLAGITGRISDFYRPSAFFLEPSHVYIYTFPHLFMLLFASRQKYALYSALMISLGLVLSTSGMGIAAVAGAWFVFFALRNEEDGSFAVKNIFRKRNRIMLGIMAVLFVAAVIFVPTVKRTVTRIFTTGTGVTAITGRISEALGGLGDLTFLQWIIGVEDNTHSIPYNMPGLVAALYRHGIIGMVMSVEIYVRSMFKLKLPYFLICGVILVTSLFSAHTHSTIGMLYYITILMYGYQTQRREGKKIR